MRRLATLIMLMIGLLVLPARIFAGPPPQGGLSFGDEVSGNITNDQYRQLFSFAGRAGQVVTITMVRESGNLDPFLLLVTETGNVLTYNDDADGSQNAALQAIALPIDGQYTIIATRFGQAHGITTGSFRLTLDGLGNNLAPVSSGGTLLRYGDEVIGEINDEQPWTVYRLVAERGDVINVALSRAGGDLDPQLDLFDPDGRFLISGDDNDSAPGTLDARITNFPIPTDGTYYIRATRYGWESGDTSGIYTLEISAAAPEVLGTRPSNARILDVGDLYISRITEATLTRFFQFEARRGEIVTAVVTRTSDDLAPRVSLLRADLSPLVTSSNDPDAESVRTPAVTITANGTYLVTVSRVEGVEGTTSGEFSLQVTTREGNTEPGILEVVYDGIVHGAIGDNNIADTYMFMGNAGDVINIAMQRTGGELDALLSLQNSDGKLLISDDDSFAEGSRDALIAAYTLDRDGAFFIEASRFNRIDGDSSGTYLLTLQIVEDASN